MRRLLARFSGAYAKMVPEGTVECAHVRKAAMPSNLADGDVGRRVFQHMPGTR